MDYNERYLEWKSFARDDETAAELLRMENDEPEKKSRFSEELNFGTAGLRGKMGAGTNRMNIYTVRKATQGFAEYVKKHGGAGAGVAISFDTRKYSQRFAQIAARCLAANGIKTYLFTSAASVPELSFAILHLKAFGGIAITASHNPKDYNGFKAYAPWGGQLLDDKAKEVTGCIDGVCGFGAALDMDLDEAVKNGIVEIIGEDIDSEYQKRLLELPLRKDNIEKYAQDITFVYTPLYGTGLRTFTGVFKRLAYRYLLVDEQCVPDPEFPGMTAPNPEDETAMKKAVELAKRVSADIAMGTDPDADRMGAAAPNREGEYIMLSGNQIGCIIIEYLLRQMKESGRLRPGDYIVKSFVSTRMADEIAKSYGIECVTVPTGFKYVADAINKRKRGRFVFGFEESGGFLAGDIARDKDGVMAMLLILETLCECKEKGETLYSRLQSLYGAYGWHNEKVISAQMEGEDGMMRISAIMRGLRTAPPELLGGQKVLGYADYKDGKYKYPGGMKPLDFPRENAVIFDLEKGWFCVRPSGTEPKIKIYAAVCGKTQEEAKRLSDALAAEARKLIG